MNATSLAGTFLAAVSLCFEPAPLFARAGPGGQPPTYPLFKPAPARDGVPVVHFAPSPIADFPPGRFLAPFTVRPGVTYTLELARFNLLEPGARIVLGHRDGPDTPLAFDPARITLLRGTVVGYTGSHVFLALSDLGSTGSINLGPGNECFGISGMGHGNRPLGPGQLSVFRAIGPGATTPFPEPCGLDHQGDDGQPPQPPGPIPPQTNPRGVDPRRGLQQLEIALETDFEYFSLFHNTDAAAAYLIELFAADSDIYMREVNTYITVSYIRIWDNANDLFNEPDPLGPFQTYWNNNQQAVHRDVAQLVSGRRDFPYGGVAYVNGLCNSNSYSVVGYIQGAFASPDSPSVYHTDIELTTHELGHNCGAQHTDAYGIDTCNNPNTPARRGTIMSYCSQTVSGGSAGLDLRFHTLVRNAITTYVNGRLCIADDCNRNGINDAMDISSGHSLDVNTNGIPDECEDCNGNGILDSLDISSGRSLDVNTNGIPDECEPDCNHNGVPDSVEIAANPSLDLNGNRILDSCEADLNQNGVSDYNEIQANMTLDLDRDGVLDSVEDCDNDGVPDSVELGGANGVWIVSNSNDVGLRQFYPFVGTLMRTTGIGRILNGQDVAIRADGHVFVTSADTNSVIEFDQNGGYVRDFVPAGSGGLAYPTGLLFAPTGNLLVCSRGNNRVVEYDGSSGAAVRTLVAGGSGGLLRPFGLVIGPSGHLFVTSDDGRVLEFNASSGAFIRALVTVAGNGGLANPRGLCFKPGGHLLVASYDTDQVLEYDGSTGAFIGQFNHGGVPPNVLQLDGPWDIRMGPDGQVYVSRNIIPRLHVTMARIFIFDVNTGGYRRSYVLGNDTGLFGAAGFDFVPDLGRDCNHNLVPDSCDIARATSRDCNHNGVPDECEQGCRADWNGIDCVNSQDFFDFLSDFFAGHADFNNSNTTDSQDFFDFLTAFFLGC